MQGTYSDLYFSLQAYYIIGQHLSRDKRQTVLIYRQIDTKSDNAAFQLRGMTYLT